MCVYLYLVWTPVKKSHIDVKKEKKRKLRGTIVEKF